MGLIFASRPLHSGTSQGAIAGCSAQPVAPSNGTYTATCSTTFKGTAGFTGQTPNAVYTADSASGVAGSSTTTSGTIQVGAESTTTSLSASSTDPAVNSPVTFTATVTAQYGFSPYPLDGQVVFPDRGGIAGGQLRHARREYRDLHGQLPVRRAARRHGSIRVLLGELQPVELEHRVRYRSDPKADPDADADADPDAEAEAEADHAPCGPVHTGLRGA
jgi:hypothetical protein